MNNMNCKLSDLLDMIDPLTGETRDTGVMYWKASTLVGSETLLAQYVEIFADFLLENLMDTVKLRPMQLSNRKLPMKDQLKSLHEVLAFLRIFLKDPPRKYPEDGKWILVQIETVVSKVEAFMNKFSVNELTEYMIGELSLAH
ncbi:hypothetical protein ACH5RR_036130 [Cinchona calisaya]|uniref:Uncharacterized protein n=1 Tax=Cinchona calisaya TaxID=153742 RepID=A0ABD2Y2B2_9GENT